MKHRSPAKRLSHLLEYLALRCLVFLLGIIPARRLDSAAAFLGAAAFRYLKIRRGVTMANLRAALGDEVEESVLAGIALQAYQNMAITFIEAVLMGKITDRIPAMVDLAGIEQVQRHIEQGRGVILAAAHFGNWELSAAAAALAGLPLTAIANRQSNPLVDRYINSCRAKTGIKIIRNDVSVKHLVRDLRAGRAVGILTDQNAGRRGVFVNFFDRPASTHVGVSRLALKYGAPIIVSLSTRVAPGRYKAVFREVPVLENDSITTLTQRYTGIIEEIIRLHPEQYFWMHRRWKTRPPLAAGPGSATQSAEGCHATYNR